MNLLLNIASLLLALIPLPALNVHLAQQLESQTLTRPLSASLPEYQISPIPVKVADKPLRLTAASAYAVDLASNQTLYSSHASELRPIASITKLVTALVILGGHDPNEIITIPPLPAYTAGDELAGLQPGMRLSVRDLLAALLIKSGNDAADALAINDSGSREAFAAKMNQFVSRWGITEAHFSNPSGLSDVDNGAAAESLAKIGSLALRNETITQLIKTPNTAITASDGRTLKLTTTNQLLLSNKFYGIKTGYTLAAGQCFIGLTTIQGHQVITVILGSQDRFGESRLLADWINKTYRWQ
ncbi:MAG TPA: serine hydrolase [Candidatus Polarisedimenticolaceae bacterium]|nr:serine hydrolase [Candidatus Polarisedimenticolaceae bacterium]